jgi:hypothetical protein
MIAKALLLIFAAIIVILLYACLCVSAGNEEELYRDDWAQKEWIKNYENKTKKND